MDKLRVWRKVAQYALMFLLFLLLHYLILSQRLYAFIALEVAGLKAFSLTLLIIFNQEFLIPKLLIRKKYVVYITSVLLCIAFSIFIAEFLENALGITDSIKEYVKSTDRRLPPPEHWRGMHRQKHQMERHISRMLTHFSHFQGFMFYLVITLVSTIIQMSVHATERERETAVLKGENVKSELAFLKSQINPHFLFNLMNNLYTLSILKSDQTPDMILKLSDMLRYMLYEANAEAVSLQKELAYINNYIDFQKLKDEHPLNIDVAIEVAHPEHRQIAPMLFISFVENSFKHSKIEDLENGWIKLAIKEVGQELFFHLSNSKSASSFTKDKTGGIGLVNVRRRLDLLYPNAYELTMKDEATFFEVNLKIKLS